MNIFDLVIAVDNKLEVDGELVQYRPSWQNLVIVGRIATDTDLADEQKIKGITQVLTGHIYTGERGLAIINAYYDRYFEKNSKGHKVIDFAQDAERIYASFQASYNIDLHTSNITASEFLALLQNLPDNSALSKVVQIRTMELPKDPQARARLQKAKQDVSLTKDNGIDNFSKSFQNMARRKGK